MYGLGGGIITGVVGGAAALGNGAAQAALPYTGFAFGAYLIAAAGLMATGVVLKALGGRQSRA